MRHSASHQALTIEVYDGEVIVRAADRPFAVSLTPEAAAETAALLAEAAREAAGHQASQTGSGDS